MSALLSVLICILLLPASSSPDRSSIPILSADTVTLSEVRRRSDRGPVLERNTAHEMLVVERPVDASEGARSSVFLVEKDGVLLRRVHVAYGRLVPSTIQIVRGVSLGDRIVVSDTRAWDAFDRVRLRP